MRATSVIYCVIFLFLYKTQISSVYTVHYIAKSIRIYMHMNLSNIQILIHMV